MCFQLAQPLATCCFTCTYIHVLEVILCVVSAIRTSWSQTLMSAATFHPHNALRDCYLIVKCKQPPQLLHIPLMQLSIQQCKKRRGSVCVCVCVMLTFLSSLLCIVHVIRMLHLMPLPAICCCMFVIYTMVC